MKTTSAFKSLLLCLLLSLGFQAIAGSTNRDHSGDKKSEERTSARSEVMMTRKVDTTVSVSQGIRLDLENRYGNVLVETWDRDEIDVEVNITVRDKDEKKAQKVMNNLDIVITHSGTFLRLRTVTDVNKGGMKRFIQDVTPFDKTKVDIDYKLRLPAYTQLDIENKFGDVYVDGVQKEMNLTLSYGDFRSTEVPAGSYLDLSFANADLTTVQSADIKLTNGRLDIRRAGVLDLTTSGSEIRIDKVRDLQIDGRRDEYNVEEANQVSGDARFCQIEVELLGERIDMELQYGGIELEKISPDFREVRIEQHNADVEIGVGAVPFDLQAYLEAGQFIWPGDLAKLDVDMVDEKKKIRTISGRVGQASSSGLGRFVFKGDGGEFVVFK